MNIIIIKIVEYIVFVYDIPWLCPSSIYMSSIIPIPKGSKASLTSSDKYSSIVISSVIEKILDHVIIDRLSDCLKTSDYQFGFKSKSSTVLSSTMVNGTIQYYSEKGGKRIYLLLLDATKAFDKVSYKVLFDILLRKKVCLRIVNLLYYMYRNQLCHVKWGDKTSAVSPYQMALNKVALFHLYYSVCT